MNKHQHFSNKNISSAWQCKILISTQEKGWIWRGGGKMASPKHLQRVTWSVPARETHPSLLQMRWTWVSTHIPWTSFQAMCKTYILTRILAVEATFGIKLFKFQRRTRWAIFGPIPGSSSNSSSELGISPLYFTIQIFETFFKLRAFVV